VSIKGKKMVVIKTLRRKRERVSFKEKKNDGRKRAAKILA